MGQSWPFARKQRGRSYEDQFQRYPLPEISPYQEDLSFTLMFQKFSQYEASVISLKSSAYLAYQPTLSQQFLLKEASNMSRILQAPKQDSKTSKGRIAPTANSQSEKKNYPIFICRDIKTVINSCIKLKKRGKLPENSSLLNRFLQFFSKGSRMSESIKTLRLFLAFQKCTPEKDQTKKITEQFSSLVQINHQKSQINIQTLSANMRQWVLDKNGQLLKIIQKRKNTKYLDYVNTFLEDLKKGEVKVYRKNQ